jgi:hypothetical protein
MTYMVSLMFRIVGLWKPGRLMILPQNFNKQRNSLLSTLTWEQGQLSYHCYVGLSKYWHSYHYCLVISLT